MDAQPGGPDGAPSFERNCGPVLALVYAGGEREQGRIYHLLLCTGVPWPWGVV